MNTLSFTSPTSSGSDAVDTVYIVNPNPFKVRITGGYIMPGASVSTHASNYITTTIKKGSDTIATHTTNSSGGSALTAGTALALTLSGTVAKVYEIAAGGVITVDVAKAGTGPAYEFAVVMIGEAIPA